MGSLPEPASCPTFALLMLTPLYDQKSRVKLLLLILALLVGVVTMLYTKRLIRRL